MNFEQGRRQTTRLEQLFSDNIPAIVTFNHCQKEGASRSHPTFLLNHQPRIKEFKSPPVQPMTQESTSLRSPRSRGALAKNTPCRSSLLDYEGNGLSPRHNLSPGAEDVVFEFSSNPYQSSPITPAPRRRTRHRNENETSAKSPRENTNPSQPKQDANMHENLASTTVKPERKAVSRPHIIDGASSCGETSSIRRNDNDVNLHDADSSLDQRMPPVCVVDGDTFEESSFETSSLFKSTLMRNTRVDSGSQLDSSSDGVNQKAELSHRNNTHNNILKTSSNLFPVLSAHEGTETNTVEQKDEFLAWSMEERLSEWKCQACTFMNENALHLTCDMCGGIRETDSSTPSESLTSSHQEDVGTIDEAQRVTTRSRSQKVEDEYLLVVEIERSKELIELQKELLEEYASRCTDGEDDVGHPDEKNRQPRPESSSPKLSNLMGGDSQTSSTFDTTVDDWHNSDGLFGASVLFSGEQGISNDERQLVTPAKARE